MSSSKSRFLLVGKRALDCVAAGLLLLAFSPIFVLLALLVRRDGGSALFRSRRIGRDGTEFYALKFRSMVPNAEAVLQDLIQRDAEVRKEWFNRFKLDNDPRVTPIGRFLRKSSLDELPQLLNVLSGQMSLVGPRPLLPEERELHSPQDFALYCSMNPGITGLWQTNGRDNLHYSRRIELNNWYVRNWSPLLDFSIIIKTIAVLQKRSDAS